MIRISPNLHGVDTSDAWALCDALARAVKSVPVFSDGPLPVVIVLPSSLLWQMNCMPCPDDRDTSRNFVQWMLDHYGRIGLHSFVNDDDDDDQEVSVDVRLVKLLALHPDTYLRDGSKRWLPQSEEIKDLRHRLEHAERLLRGEMTPEHEQALDCDHPGAWRDLALMRTAELERQRAETDRMRMAMLHIATGGISPAIGFAQRILFGDTIEDAHLAEVAIMTGEHLPTCRRCDDRRKVIDYTSRDEPRFYDCPACNPVKEHDP